MAITKGIIQHPIVLCMDRKERGILLQGLLSKAGYKVIVTLNLYEAINAIAQEMPHLIIADSLVSDGSAGTLFDRLGQHSLLKATPILVCVAKKTAEHLTPLKGRQFCGFLLGEIDPDTLLNKVAETLQINTNGSPYLIPIDGTALGAEVLMSVKATVVGRTKEQAVYRSAMEVDSKATLVCVPQDPKHSPVILSGGTNFTKGDESFNLFPIARIRGKGRKWLNELPTIQQIGGESRIEDDTHRVVFFDSNQSRFEQFRTILSGHQIELLAAATMQEAQLQLESHHSSLACVYLQELAAGPSVINFKKAHAAIPAGQRPPLIVGTSSQNAKNTPYFRYIKKPFGLNGLLEMISSCYTKPEKLNDISTSGREVGHISVNYQATARLIGLDESGGVIQIKFPIVQGSKITLNHPLLQEIWNGDLEVTVSAVQNSANSDVWQARIVPRAIAGSKTKYWTKASKLITDWILAQTVFDADAV